MFVSGVGMCFEYISSHPHGRTAGSLIEVYILYKVPIENNCFLSSQNLNDQQTIFLLV